MIDKPYSYRNHTLTGQEFEGQQVEVRSVGGGVVLRIAPQELLTEELEIQLSNRAAIELSTAILDCAARQ